MDKKEAQHYTNKHFRRVKSETTHSSNCYTEWYEVWEKVEGTVTEEDLQAFRLQPRGQGHHVLQVSPVGIRLNCVCDSGD